MSRGKKFDTGWYAGSVREAKRAAFIAGAEAVLDLAAKEFDRTVKQLQKEPMSDTAKNALADLQVRLFNNLYQKAISEVIARTPFEPPAPMNPEEPDSTA